MQNEEQGATALQTSATPAEPTKIVKVKLSAYLLCEYIEHIEVPAVISDDELKDLVEERYQDVDGGLFVEDPHYWERSTCQAEAPEPGAMPTLRAVRTESGLKVEPVETTDEEPQAS